MLRTHGGAVSVEPALYEPFRHVSSFGEQEQKFTAEKRRIGLAAAQMIAVGEIVSIGAGTTTIQVARSLRHRKHITVITNALNAAMELSQRSDLKVFVSGGFLSPDWFALVGPAAAQNIGEMFADKVFIGVDGIHAEHGLTTNYLDQAAIVYLEPLLSSPQAEATALYSLGLAYVRLQRKEVATVVPLLTGRKDGAALARLLQGQAFLDEFELIKAAAEFKAAAKLSNELPRLNFLLGLTYYKLGRSPEAGGYLFARALQKLGRKADAARAFAEAQRLKVQANEREKVRKPNP